MKIEITNKNDENAVVGYHIAFLQPCVTLMHGYNSNATAIAHYFVGALPHFSLYSPCNVDYRISVTAVQINHIFPICRVLRSPFRWS